MYADDAHLPLFAMQFNTGWHSNTTYHKGSDILVLRSLTGTVYTLTMFSVF